MQTMQKRTGLYVSCLEEIANLRGYITKEQLLEAAKTLEKSEYGQYLKRVAREK